ncbi:MAG: hypothetical protein JNM56_05020 [Planctomycetia bacterium]|nr:hypothetical protein [Planctomycetia bacterium]
MNFFFDRCMPIRIARMVNAYENEHTARHHDEDNRFTITTPDVEWMAALASDVPPWLIISGDGRILKNKVECAILRSTGLVFFCLAKGWMSMKFPDYAWRFIKAWPAIVEHATHSKARVFEIGAGSGLKITPLQ